MCVDPKDPRRVAVSTVYWDSRSGGKIYLSQDSGENWRDITGDLPNGTGAAAMAFDNSDTYLYIIRYVGSVYKLRMKNDV